MKKRLLSLVLMLVMVLSLAGCGSKAATPKDVLAAMAEVEVGTAVYEMDFVVGEETVNIKATASQKDNLNSVVTVEAKFNMPESGYAIEEYVPVTEMYVLDGTEIYINLGQIFDFLVEIDSQFAMIESLLGLPADYLMISYDDLIQLYEDMGMDTSELELTMPSEEDMELYNKTSDVVVEVFGDFLNEYATNAGESVLAVKDGKLTFTMDAENMVKVVEAMAAIDVEGYAATLGTKLDEVMGSNEFSALFAEEFEGVNDSIKSAAEEIKNAEADGFEKMTATMGVNDKNVEATIVVTGKESSAEDAGDVKMNMTMLMTPEKAKEINAPTDVMDIYELMDVINTLSGSMY